ncbi:hypothetical protein CDD83_4895 [Cordyceps sp. RAO-2017]|nr:hypothetical protein CDD83_4895 [Cordyceps sp. RAO-2017]
MAPPSDPNDRQRRIVQLSQQWDIALPPPLAPLTPPSQPPSFRTPADDQAAEELMQRRAAEVAQYRPKSSIRHAFSSANLKKGKNWDPRETLEVLAAWIANAGSPGVAEALLAKMAAAGLDLTGPAPRQKGGILNRRRATDSGGDRARLLRLAVDGRQLELAQMLLPHAESFALDACLPAAIRAGDAAMAELLLRHGASAAQTADGQDAFRQACAIHGQSHLVSLLLRSDGRPSPPLASAALCEAARAGCLETVLYLSRSNADGDHNRAEALKSAVSLGRRDIALAIVMGNHPPRAPGLDEAFQMLQEHSSLNPSLKLELAELLLCAGAQGPVVAHALDKSYHAHFGDMAALLAAYGASAEYNDAAVLKSCISRGEMGLVETLLGPGAALSPSLASSCVPLIEKQAPHDQRHAILSLLLRRGASGSVLDEMLVDAAEAGDVRSLDLLLNPFYPPPTSPRGSPRSPSSGAGGRHEVASVDYKSGEALRTALLRNDLEMTHKILSRQPSQETLSAVFPLTKKLSNVDRYPMVELFLSSSLSGPCLHSALHDAINEDVSKRDNSLVKLLLRYDADVNFGQGTGLASLIKQRDTELLGVLLQKASPQTAAARVHDVMRVSDHRARFDMMIMLLDAGAVIGTEQVAAALLEALSEKPVDMSLVRLLLQRGSADVNLLDGAIVKQAVANPDPEVLELLFSQGRPSAASISHGLRELVSLPSNEAKARKLDTVVSASTRGEDLSWVLVHEVQSVAQSSSAETTSLSALKYLLASGADPNDYKAAALCHAVIAAKSQIVDMLFNCRLPPKPPALGAALPHALRISEPMERLTLTKKLVQGGASPHEINRALTHAIATYPKDVSLLGVLAVGADTSDGEALGLSVSQGSPEILDLLLAKTESLPEVRSSLLGKVMGVKDHVARRKMCRSLVAAGASTEAASSALLVAARDGDVELGDVLMSHGASLASHDGRAVVEACRGGSAEVLAVLLAADPDADKKTLQAGFQAATEVGDLSKRAAIFEQLLKRGLRGDLVDEQLQSSVRYGQSGLGVVKVLLASGADPNYNNGECVVSATRSAFVDSLELLLGLWHSGGNKKKVSQPNLARALAASWGLERESRFRIIGDLFKAGLEATDDLHKALNDAVNEENPEERLVKLLLEHGASPSVNGCKTLADAARLTACLPLALILQKELAEEDVNDAFSQAFTSSNFDNWFTDAGLETARLLLDKSAHAEALSHALVLVMKNSTTETRPLADRFFDLFVGYGPNIDYKNGELLQQSASRADVPWTERLLDCRPSARTLSLAFQCIFDTELSQEGVLDLFTMFAEYKEDGVGIDVMVGRQGSEPVLVRAIRQYPRSTRILSTLLDAGFYQDQAATCRVYPEVEEDEEVTLLLWAIAQPQKRVSTAVIALLVERGANVKTEASLSRTTPLMLAVQTRRPDLVKLLLLDGADVDAIDYRGRTALSMATEIGGDIAVQMMSSLLAAEPSRDDGSLHNAARDLNLPAVRVLVQSGHDPDFPSPLHGGRSALGEVRT